MPIDTPGRAGERREMIAALQAVATRLPSGLRAAVEYPGVLDAMANVPREAFVPEGRRDLAYRPTALDIGHGQTISQPLIVAVMTGLLRQELGFTGLALTDSLEMGALATSGYPAPLAAAHALAAGADLLLFNTDYDVLHEAHAAILGWVADGRIGQARLDEAVLRVLSAKARYGLL